MKAKSMTRRDLLRWMGLGVAGSLVAACQPKVVERIVEKPVERVVTQIVKEVVKETVIVEGKEKVVTKIVEKVVEKVVTNTPAPEAPVQIMFVESWFGVPQFQASLDPVTDAISKKMQDEGLNIKMRSVVLDDHETKYPILYAAGEDFAMAFDAPWYRMTSLIDQGYLLPLERMIEEHGPSITKIVTQEVLDANITRGHNYGIPAYFYYGQTSGPVIRADLREKYGAPEPLGQWDSLEPFLVAIKENEPDMIPLVPGESVAKYPHQWPTVTWSPGDALPGCSIPNLWEEAKYADVESEEWWVESCELLRRWWEMDLIPKTPPLDMDIINELFIPGKCAAYADNEPDYKYADRQVAIEKFVPGAKVMGYDVSGQRAGKIKIGGRLRQWNFVVYNAQQPFDKRIAAVQFFNWLMSSQDNMDMWLFGVDGVNYKKEPNMRYSEIEGLDQTRNYRRQWYVSGCPGKYQRLDIALPKPAEEAVIFLSTFENFRLNPLEGFLPETKPYETELATLLATQDEVGYPLDYGELPTDEAIAAWTKGMDAAGRQKVKVAFQEQLDAWIEQNKPFD